MKHSEAFVKLVDEVRPHITEISSDDVLAMQAEGRKFRFIDVREDHEWAGGRARDRKSVV